MKIKTWPYRAASVIASLGFLLSACGGSSGSSPEQAVPTATKLNAENAMDAAGVGWLALQRTQSDVARVFGAALTQYMQQPPAGAYPCPKGGQLTLSRPSATAWHYTAGNCDTGELLLRSGALQIDADVPDVGLRVTFKDLSYGFTARPAAAPQLVNGRYDVNINVTTDLGRRSVGELGFTSNARTDQYPEVYIASKASDPGFLQYGVKIKSPRFAHELTLLLDEASKTLTLQADDGSVLALVEQASGEAKLELRTAAGAAPSVTRNVSVAEREGAIARALQ